MFLKSLLPERRNIKSATGVIAVTENARETRMISSDAGDYFLLISSIFFPQEKLGPGSSRPTLFAR
jgi:hypothetical protein